MEYILYVGQEANFQSRCMLIPAKEFIRDRPDIYNKLKERSIKNHTIEDCLIDNLLLQNYDVEGSRCTPEIKDYSEYCWKLTHYADGLDCIDEIDKEWYDKSILLLGSLGFNHIKNYTKIKNMKQYNIIDGFLVLETRDGKLERPDVDTVEEMYAKYY
jgi:hypothetical protein